MTGDFGGSLIAGLRAGKELCNMKKKSAKKAVTHPQPLITSMTHPHPSATDPLGSWTGIPADEGEGPTQDADDL